MSDEDLIVELKKHLNEAIRRKDVAATIAAFGEKTVMFVLNPPLRFTTGENAPGAKGIEAWYATFASEIGLAYQELEITLSGDVAFAHCVEHLTGKRTDGTTTDMWYRETLGLRKMEGLWKITHRHQSVPIYMDGSGKAATDLKP